MTLYEIRAKNQLYQVSFGQKSHDPVVKLGEKSHDPIETPAEKSHDPIVKLGEKSHDPVCVPPDPVFRLILCTPSLSG